MSARSAELAAAKASVIAYGRQRHEYTLRDGRKVLGKLYEGEVSPKTYANRTQAQKSATREGGEVVRGVQSRVFFVRLP